MFVRYVRRIGWLAAATLVPAAVCAQTRIGGAYTAHVEVRSGTCCSASCGGVSTLADVTLTLASGGAATLRWTRTGCLVTIAPAPGEHAEMPRDPGPPEGFCRYTPPGAEVLSMAGEATQQGSWRAEGETTIVRFEPSTTLRCTPSTIDGHAVLDCVVDATGLDTTGLTLAGHLYLDRRPGLSEHLDPYSDQLVLERR